MFKEGNLDFLKKENLAENQKSILVSPEELIPNIKPGKESEKFQAETYGRNFPDEYLANLWKSPFFSGEYFQCLAEGCDAETLESVKLWDFVGYAFNKFKDQIVVDLGCGRTSLLAYSICTMAKAKGYIGVDNNHDDAFYTLNKGIKESVYQKAKEKGVIDPKLIPASFSHDDMLTFLKRLPDNSVSVITSGIDSNVLHDENYRDEVRNEIKRILSDKGAYFSYDSVLHPEDLRHETTAGPSELHIYTKAENHT